MKCGELPSSTTMPLTASIFSVETAVAAVTVIIATRERFSSDGQTSNDKGLRRGAKILASLRRVTIRSSTVCFRPKNIQIYV